MDVNNFVTEFMKTNNSLLSNIIRRYVIPNRYTVEDVKQYITEKIISVLNNRDGQETNRIENPEKYFKSCISFYCIEYQRMHGYIFELPKRPRRNCEEQESDIRQKGFKYIGDMTLEESMSLLDTSEYSESPAPVNTEAWHFLTGLMSHEEAGIIDCIYNRNMTWAETASFLGVPQSTCWFRKNRALEKLISYVDSFDEEASSTIRGILRLGTSNG